MYRFGTETSAVATPRWALKIASASVWVSRDAASIEYGIFSASAVSTSISKTTSLTEAPSRERRATAQAIVAMLPLLDARIVGCVGHIDDDRDVGLEPVGR